MFGRTKNWDIDEKTEVVSFLDTFTTRHQNVENFEKIVVQSKENFQKITDSDKKDLDI